MNTTIQISKETRELLKEYGKKSETYDEVIKRMHNSLKMREMLETMVNPEEWMSLEDFKEWIDKKIENERKSKNRNTK